MESKKIKQSFWPKAEMERERERERKRAFKSSGLLDSGVRQVFQSQKNVEEISGKKSKRLKKRQLEKREREKRREAETRKC